MSGIEGNFDDEEVEEERSGKPCEGSRKDLIKCLRESECVQQGGDPKECLLSGEADCNHFRVSFFECKRSLLDNRVRFRGRKGY